MESIVTVKGPKNSRDQHQVSVLERCLSHREYSYSKRTEKKRRDQHQVSTLERCPSHGKYSYSKMSEKRQGPTPGVCLREVSIS